MQDMLLDTLLRNICWRRMQGFINKSRIQIYNSSLWRRSKNFDAEIFIFFFPLDYSFYNFLFWSSHLVWGKLSLVLLEHSWSNVCIYCYQKAEFLMWSCGTEGDAGQVIKILGELSSLVLSSFVRECKEVQGISRSLTDYKEPWWNKMVHCSEEQ